MRMGKIVLLLLIFFAFHQPLLNNQVQGIVTDGSNTYLHQSSVLKIAVFGLNEFPQQMVSAFLNSEEAKQAGLSSTSDIEILTISNLNSLERALSSSILEVSLAWGLTPLEIDYLAENDAISAITDASISTLLDEINSANNSFINPAYYNLNHELVGLGSGVTTHGILWNTELLQQKGIPSPNSWSDLALPIYYSDDPFISIMNATNSRMYLKIYQIILQQYGWDEGWRILYSLAGNGKMANRSASAVREVMVGKIPITIVPYFKGLIAMKENPSCYFHVPVNDTVIETPYMVLSKNPPNLNAALAFMRFVLSAEGQRVWLDLNRIGWGFQLPYRSDAFDGINSSDSDLVHRVFTQLTRMKSIEFNYSLAEGIENAVMYYFDATIDDVYPLFSQTYRMVVTNYTSGRISEYEFNELMRNFTSPLLSIEDALAMNQRLGEDSSYREQKVSKWSSEAHDKYYGVQASLYDFLGLSFTTPWEETTSTNNILTSEGTSTPTLKLSFSLFFFFNGFMLLVYVFQTSGKRKK